MSKRVLLTGGAGFIGSHLARRLLDRGYEVDLIDNLSTGSRDNLPAGADFLELDLTDPSFPERLWNRNYQAVAHLAGQSAGEKSFDDPLYDLDANTRSTLALSQWARQRGIPTFVYASSMGVYGQPERLPAHEFETPTLPLSFYGHSKLAGEGVLRIQQQQGLRTVSMRMFSVYGPGQNLADLRQGMVSIFLAMLLRGQTLSVRGSLDRVRDFVYIDDVVEAWMAALERPVSGPFNLGTGVPTRVDQLIEALKAALDRPEGQAVPGGLTPGDQTAVYADISRARTELGWEPQVSLGEGLARMVAWARPGVTQ